VTKLHSNIVSLEKNFLPGLHCSTALAGAAIQAIISWEIIGSSLTGWFLVTYEELLKMLGRALKAGIPMEKSLTRFIWASYTTMDCSQPQVQLGGSTPKPTIKTTTTFPHVPQTSFSPCTSFSKQELVQVFEKSQGSKHSSLNYSGSTSQRQPQFHEVLPEFYWKHHSSYTFACYEAFWKVGWDPVVNKGGDLYSKS